MRSSRPVRQAGVVGVVKIANASRALADAGVYEVHAASDLEHLAISVLQRGLTTAEDLEKELWLRPQKKVAPIWKGLEAFVAGAWSRPEVVHGMCQDYRAGLDVDRADDEADRGRRTIACPTLVLWGERGPLGFLAGPAPALHPHRRTFVGGAGIQNLPSGTCDRRTADICGSFPQMPLWNNYLPLGEGRFGRTRIYPEIPCPGTDPCDRNLSGWNSTGIYEWGLRAFLMCEDYSVFR